MWKCAALLVAVFTIVRVDGEEIFDVTTIYNVRNLSEVGGSSQDVMGRVHSRTNARGLPIELETTPETLPRTCTQNEIQFKEGGILKSSHNIYGGYINCAVVLVAPPNWQIELEFTDIKANRRDVSRRRYDYRYGYYSESECDGIKVYDGPSQNSPLLGKYCTKSESKLLLSSANKIFIKFNPNSGEGFSATFKKVTAVTSGGTEIEVPVSYPGSKHLCLALSFHSSDVSKGNLLKIKVVDQLSGEHLQTINDVKAGWNIKHAEFMLQTNLSSSINLMIQKIGSIDVKITNISSCNPDGDVVFLLPQYITPSVIKSDLRSHLTVYKAHPPVPLPAYEISDGSKQCLNGGKLTTAGCACPPGFTGNQCQTGCGKNRFGQDCKGLCSIHTQACEGLLMCTDYNDCRCGPGYTGNYCQQKCLPGWYGNDCSLQCKHCASGMPCDIYTGKCASCELGYVLPSCQQEYVHYTSKPEVSSASYGTLTVSFNPKNVAGQGTPKLYQIQYREKDGIWRTYTTKVMPASVDKQDSISETINGLKDGIPYQVRVLLMDASFNKYDGDLVQISEIITKCDKNHNYNVTTTRNTTSLTFAWTYGASEHSCPVETYEVSWKDDWQWLTEHTERNFTLTNMLPGSTVELKVRAKTTTGFAPYSETVKISTYYNVEDLSTVEDLQMVSAQSRSVKISWQPPFGSEDIPLMYRVKYKCVEQPACPPGCFNTSESELTQPETNVTLSQLLPFTQYKVSVFPEHGPERSIYVGTTEVVSTETPRVSTRVPMQTNTSVTVAWDEVPVCSSFLLGYNYHLVKESDNLTRLVGGFTNNTIVSFHNLTPSTDYIVKVFVVTTAGWNPESFLAIRTSTSATAPEAVRDLTVYKRGRNLLGLRWAKPHTTYAKLKSFTIRHVLGKEDKSHTVEPTPCTVWPDLYCHTIEDLHFNRNYNISVTARNIAVDEDGAEATVIGLTKETVPAAPEKLKLINSSSTTICLQWSYPNLANGIIRSYVVSVEETETFELENCCQVYPLVENPVTEEMENYKVEVSGLQAASTYYVTVSAKTVGIGPPQSLVAYTRPPHMLLTDAPSQELLVERLPSLPDELFWLPQELQPDMSNSSLYLPLIKSHLLLLVLNESQDVQEVTEVGINDQQLLLVLQQSVSKQFSFLAEYNQDEVMEESEWGFLPPSFLKAGYRYQLAAVQVTEYNGVYNTDLRYSLPFTYL